MNTKIRALLCVLALSAGRAGSAEAAMVAGWDFSQYCSDGALSIDCENYTETLSANYSDLDLTSGAGVESAAYGMLYLDGSNGSTDVGAGGGTEPILPSQAAPGGASLASNLSFPSVGVDFDTHAVLDVEGQIYSELMTLQANDAVSIVFGIDLSSDPNFGTNWAISFGGQVDSSNVNLGIEFSTDGINYSSITTVILTSLDSTFSESLSAAISDTAFVRLVFADPGAGNNAYIDNVAISAELTLVPEPTTGLLLGLGLCGLGLAGRRQRA